LANPWVPAEVVCMIVFPEKSIASISVGELP